MPQRANDIEIDMARDALKMDKRLYWCVKCARPRRNKYCPVTARTTKDRHRIVLRATISEEAQLEFYVFQGGIPEDM